MSDNSSKIGHAIRNKMFEKLSLELEKTRKTWNTDFIIV